MVSDLSVHLDQDREHRLVVKPPFDVIDVPTRLDDVPLGGMLPPPGSIVVYVGDPAAPAWCRLRDAVGSGDWAAVRDADIGDFVAPWSTEEEAVEQLVKTPAYFEIRCAGRTLYRHGAIPTGAPWGTVLFPYTGGEIAPGDFEIVEYRRSSEGPASASLEVEYLILRRAPQLSALEQQLLGSIDPSMREIHVGSRRPHDINCVMDQITRNIERDIQRELDRKHQRTSSCLVLGVFDGGAIPESDVAEVLGKDQEAAASVAELLLLRRRMLGES
ncbi:hypothetical protein [Yinghuangia soli]|uniref:Uncharacterized protein n=1 Tax=Yinghuangia soli TaxID=2908204 RepID=A0AA41PZI8_9ACTN|nr:hypothetical protein [Yinghuangia soli]MCF2528803.1 hypothetical protein [Yinghuangia soli]